MKIKGIMLGLALAGTQTILGSAFGSPPPSACSTPNAKSDIGAAAVATSSNVFSAFGSPPSSTSTTPRAQSPVGSAVVATTLAGEMSVPDGNPMAALPIPKTPNPVGAAAAATILAAATATQNKLIPTNGANHKAPEKPKAQPKFVAKLIKFGLATQRACEFEMPVEFDENDEERVATAAAGTIPKSLWATMQTRIALGGLRCTGALCSNDLAAKLRSEDIAVSLSDLKPKMVTKRVSFGEHDWNCEACRFGANATFDEHDPKTVTVLSAGYHHPVKSSFYTKYIPQSLWSALRTVNLHCTSDHYVQPHKTSGDFNSAQYLEFSIIDAEVAPLPTAAASIAPKRINKWTIVSFSSPTQSIPCKAAGKAHCEFCEETDTWIELPGVDKAEATAVALRNIQTRKAKCKNNGCDNSSAILSHSADALTVSFIFPKTWGSA